MHNCQEGSGKWAEKEEFRGISAAQHWEKRCTNASLEEAADGRGVVVSAGPLQPVLPSEVKRWTETLHLGEANSFKTHFLSDPCISASVSLGRLLGRGLLYHCKMRIANYIL